MLLEVDIPALDGHVNQLVEILERRGIGDVPQGLMSIGMFLGVPELGARLSARSAEWLIEAGKHEEAVKHIEALGDPKQLTDLVAARLAAVLVPLSVEQKMEMFSSVASRALPKEDRWLATLELARCRHEHGDLAGALADIDRVLAEVVDEPRAMRTAALLLRFEVSRRDDDFRNAKAQLGTNGGRNQGHQLGAILTEHGDFEEAEELLAETVRSGDIIAQLLLVDARVRSGRISAARELLLAIPLARVTASLLYPYAVACALVALADGGAELKTIAVANLRKVSSPMAEVMSSRQDLLQALEGHGSGPPRSSGGVFKRLLAWRP